MCVLVVAFLLLASASITTQPQVFAPGVISGAAHESAPAFTPDGKTVYFCRSNFNQSAIMVSHLADGRWSKPVVAEFSGIWRDQEPAMAPDGSYLIFISNRPIEAGGKPLDGQFNGKSWPARGGNLWRVDWKNGHWSEAVHLPAIVNNDPSTFAPAITRDGSIYFMHPGPNGKFRLYRSQFRDGTFEQPQLQFSAADAPYSDVDPAVAPDESFVVFGSSRPPAQSMDLFIAFRTEGRWGKPEHLGTVVNSTTSDAEARLSPDGRTLYFSSDRVRPSESPRDRKDAESEMEIVGTWDNGLYNIWYVTLNGLSADHP